MDLLQLLLHCVAILTLRGDLIICLLTARLDIGCKRPPVYTFRPPSGCIGQGPSQPGLRGPERQHIDPHWCRGITRTVVSLPMRRKISDERPVQHVERPASSALMKYNSSVDNLSSPVAVTICYSPSTKYPIPSTEYRVPSTEYQVPSTDTK